MANILTQGNARSTREGLRRKLAEVAHEPGLAKLLVVASPQLRESDERHAVAPVVDTLVPGGQSKLAARIALIRAFTASLRRMLVWSSA